MPKPNRNFELSVEDVDLIEAALQDTKRNLAEAHITGEASEDKVAEIRDIHELLGRLHNQKQFYRPKAGVYVGG